MKMKKIIITIMFLLIIANVYAQDILVSTSEIDNEFIIINLNVITNNDYYINYYLDLYKEDDQGYEIKLLDASNNIIQITKVKYSTHTLIEYNDITKNTNKIIISKNKEDVFEKQVSFCNLNNVCEPCVGADCINYENELTCSDCIISNEDGFCNILNDNICDPDCVSGYGYDNENVYEDCYEDKFNKKTCQDYGWNICEENEICSEKVYLDESDTECCVGTCDEIIEHIDEPETKAKSYVWIIYVLAIIILIILGIYYVKKKNLIVISLVGLVIMSMMLVQIGWNNNNLITGYAIEEAVTKTFNAEKLLSSFPELFDYGKERNSNLLNALNLISQEFKNEGVDITPELLSAIITTLEKEVGGSFLPIEEYGDYCSGPICTYKVGGSCRGTEYGGGCDYKGRGYIQITHKSNYLTYCGSDCLSTRYNECDCVGEAYCKNQNCNPSKALDPETAARIFAQYYVGRNLVDRANKENFYDVGLRINGGKSYAIDFETRAKSKLQQLNQHPDLLEGLLNFAAVLQQAVSGQYHPKELIIYLKKLKQEKKLVIII